MNAAVDPGRPRPKIWCKNMNDPAHFIEMPCKSETITLLLPADMKHMKGSLGVELQIYTIDG